jgi:hypothetical protein
VAVVVTLPQSCSAGCYAVEAAGWRRRQRFALFVNVFDKVAPKKPGGQGAEINVSAACASKLAGKPCGQACAEINVLANAVAVAAFDKVAREEINVFVNVFDKVAPEKPDGQGAEINVFANAVAVAAFDKPRAGRTRCGRGPDKFNISW